MASPFPATSAPDCSIVIVACPVVPDTSATEGSYINNKEFAFTPAALTVTAGQPVTVTLQNNGSVDHDFSIREIEIGGEAKSSSEALGSGGHMMGGMGEQPKLHVATGPGANGTLTFTPSKPGTYAFYCTVAGHKEAGMVGVLTVKAP